MSLGRDLKCRKGASWGSEPPPPTPTLWQPVEGPGAAARAVGLTRPASPQLYLRELLRLMHPRFYQHLVSLGEDGLQMLFCHRWLLLCFKREFPEAEALRVWEACWAHYQVRRGAAEGRTGQDRTPHPAFLEVRVPV